MDDETVLATATFDKILSETRDDLIANMDRPLNGDLVGRLVGNFYRCFMRHHGVGIHGDPLTLEGLVTGGLEEVLPTESTVEITFKSGTSVVLDRVTEFKIRSSFSTGHLNGLTCRQHPDAKCRLLVQSVDLTQVVAVVERRRP